MEKYQNKYRIASARAAWWNYGWQGAYFITICTQNREHYFGEMMNGKMNLSPVGILADVFWHEIKNHAKNVDLGAFVVMPNHIHGILILNENNNDLMDNTDNIVDTDNTNIDIDIDIDIVVDTRHALYLPNDILPNDTVPNDPVSSENNPTESQKRFRNPGKNTVSSIIGGYKSAVTKHANRLGLEMGWQSRFHDHIIRNDGEYQRINDYIENNPQNWKEDKFFR